MAVFVSRSIQVPSVPKQASNYAVGESVFLNVNGTSTEFLVVNQGIPSNSSLYDSSCNGTWLLMKDIYENRAWDSDGTTEYRTSTINSYLNSTFFEQFDKPTQNAIKQVKIPYVRNRSSVGSGSSGLSTKIFLPSAYEVGWVKSDYSNIPGDGAKLSYFVSGKTSAANAKRATNLNGTAAYWWLRSPDMGEYSGYIRVVDSIGGANNRDCTESCGVRPALILDSSAKFDSKTNEFKG